MKEVKQSGVLTETSHHLHACVKVLMHIDMFSGMYTSLGSGDILVRMCGSWEKFMLDQRRSRRFFKQEKQSGVLTGTSHDLHACVNVLMHIDMFSGRYTSLGGGDILLRMGGSWEKFMVDQRRSRRILKQVEPSGALTETSHDLHACVNVLMHIDMFSGMYTGLGSGDILVRMCGSWEKFMVDHRRSTRILKEVKQSGVLTETSHDLHACVNVLMHIDMFSGMYTSLEGGDILLRMGGSWEKFMVDQRRSRRILKQVEPSGALTETSHDLHACVNVLMHIDMFSGMYTGLESGDILVRMCGSWEKFMVDQGRSRRILKQVKQSGVLTETSHDLHACVNVLMHIDMLSGMFTILGSGDILVRMCGSWEEIVLDQRSSRRILKQVKYLLASIALSHDLHACVRVLMHIDIFSGMYTSIGTGDILVGMCGSWEKIVVDQRSSSRILKQVTYSLSSIELSHDLHACVNVLMHIDIFSGIYTSLGTGDILVRMCGRWEKIVVDQRNSRRILKQVKYSLSYIQLSHDLYACVYVLMHIDMFSGMYTRQGTGDILLRMCVSWEKIVIDQRISRPILKQVKYPLSSIELSHDLHACVNVLMHIDIFSGMYTSLGTGDILVHMCGSW